MGNLQFHSTPDHIFIFFCINVAKVAEFWRLQLDLPCTRCWPATAALARGLDLSIGNQLLQPPAPPWGYVRMACVPVDGQRSPLVANRGSWRKMILKLRNSDWACSRIPIVVRGKQTTVFLVGAGRVGCGSVGRIGADF